MTLHLIMHGKFTTASLIKSLEKYGNPMMRRRHLPHRITIEAKEEWLELMHEAIQTLSIEDDLKNALYLCFPKLAEHMVNS